MQYHFFNTERSEFNILNDALTEPKAREELRKALEPGIEHIASEYVTREDGKLAKWTATCMAGFDDALDQYFDRHANAVRARTVMFRFSTLFSRRTRRLLNVAYKAALV